jgi:hypothetical protein
MRLPFSVHTPGRQPVRRVVGLLDRLRRRAERQHRQHRAEDLLAGDAVRLGHAGEHGGREPVAAVGQLAVGDQRSAPSLSPTSDSSRIAGELLGRVDRPDVGVLVERVAQPQRAEPALERVEHLLGTDSCTSSREPAQQTCPWLKKMPLTMPSTAWSTGASSKTMLAALPPSSSVSLLAGAGDLAGDRLADLGRPGEGDLVDVRVLDEQPAGLAGTGEDVDDARAAGRPAGRSRRTAARSAASSRPA